MGGQSEQQLANTLRRSLFVELSNKDIPRFLVIEIEAVFIGLNYFKLSNIRENKREFLKYITRLVREYHAEMRQAIKLSAKMDHVSPLSARDADDFWTDYLYDRYDELCVAPRLLQKMRSEFAVACTLQVKEFVYRQTYRASKLTSQTSKK